MKIKSLFAVLALSISSLTQAAVVPLDRIAAIVDDGIIMQSEVNTKLRQVMNQARSSGRPLPSESVMQEQVLDLLITENIQLQMASRGGIRISEQQLNATISKIAKQNKMTLDAFKKALASDGISYIEAREQIRTEMIISKVQQIRIGNKIQISEKDLDIFLLSEHGKTQTSAEYHLAHILISLPHKSDNNVITKARKKAKKLVKQLRNGADFASLAMANSKSGSALKGGDLGWRKEDQLPSLFSKQAPLLKKGDVSDPIQNASGFHIIKLLDKKGGDSVFVRQHKTSHILISPSEIRTEKQAQTLIHNLYARLEKGDDLSVLAKEFSNDPGSAISGGDLGWVNKGDMVPAFEKTMHASTVGEISKPFKSKFGWHIVRVEEIREQDMGREIQRNQARQLLFGRRFQDELPVWLREIRDDAYVEIKDTTNNEST
jgi:peptidyl-prolyl cis-trans isomerase SurA